MKGVFLEKKSTILNKNNICILIGTQIINIGFLKSPIFGNYTIESSGVGFFPCNPSCLSTGVKKWLIFGNNGRFTRGP